MVQAKTQNVCSALMGKIFCHRVTGQELESNGVHGPLTDHLADAGGQYTVYIMELMNISSVLYLELMKANQLSRDFSLPSLVVPPKQRIPSIYSFPSFVLQLHIDSLSIPFLTFSIPSLVA